MSEWGEGYNAGQFGLIKAVETARLMGTIEERKRILQLIATIKDNWRKPSTFDYPTELFKLMQLIEETKDNQ